MSGTASVRRFVCGACGHAHAAWAARCSSCFAHGLALVSEAPEPKPVQARQAAQNVPQQREEEDLPLPSESRLRLVRAPLPEPELSDPVDELADFDSDEYSAVPISEIVETSYVRDSTGLTPLDYVLGGGLVVNSVVLLTALPGAGKSTLTLQMLHGLGHRTLYVTGEETKEQVAVTAHRIGAVSSQLYVLPERRLSKIFATAKKLRVRTIAIDSIQKMICDDVSGRAGTPTQVKASMELLTHFAKTMGTALWVVGHVTSDGDAAGPKTLEHDCDAVLELAHGTKFDGNERILRCPGGKNRFGAANLVGYFELTAKGLKSIDADGWDEPL